MSMSNTTKRVKEIRRKTRRKFSSEEKIRIVLEGLRCILAHWPASARRRHPTTIKRTPDAYGRTLGTENYVGSQRRPGVDVTHPRGYVPLFENKWNRVP